ncbi:MAG TPA: M23 family metallopeptidase [Gemmatimonadaceae bacterium]|nr:M23 family metallopeptidase [Gemmatimonadaceae bacterium]
MHDDHRSLRRAIPLLLAALTACEVVKDDSAKRDTTTAPATGAAPSTTDSGSTPSGVPAAPSADSTAASRDTGVVTLSSDSPTRGGVLFALAEGLAADIPRCSWKGASLPCYRVDRGVLAVVPLPADEPAGTFTLVFDRPTGRITRQITVGDRDFGRELVFLDSATYALVRRSRDVARDARAIRAVLATESAQRRWSGSWGAPVSARGGGYGAERFYYRAVDSSRAIRLTSEMRAAGAFGTDTASGSTPSWRHAGVDLAAARGTAVTAPAAGVVADVGDYVLSGHTVVVDHGQGVMTAYFHLDTALVRRGDEVRKGQRLGRVGDTGLATGPHLHYGVYVHGKDVDPAAWAAMPAFARGEASRTTANR